MENLSPGGRGEGEGEYESEISHLKLAHMPLSPYLASRIVSSELMPCDDNFGPGFFNVKEIISHIVRFTCLGEWQTRGYGFVIASEEKQSPVIPVNLGNPGRAHGHAPLQDCFVVSLLAMTRMMAGSA